MNQTKLVPTADGFRDEAAGKQLLKWGRCRWDTLQPTDVDALIEWRGTGFTIIEVKRVGAKDNRGQEWAFTRAVDAMTRGGCLSIYIKSLHNIPAPNDIYLDDLLVKKYYIRSEWKSPEHPTTTYDLCDYFQRNELKLNL